MKKLFLICMLLVTSVVYAQNFNLQSLKQKTIHIENFDGNFIFKDPFYSKQKVLFFFFGTRCPYCEKEIPDILALVNYKNLRVIGVHAQFPIENQKLQNFAKDKSINFDVLGYKDGEKLVRYLTRKGMWIGGVPYYVLVDKHGNLEPLDFNQVLEKIQQH